MARLVAAVPCSQLATRQQDSLQAIVNKHVQDPALRELNSSQTSTERGVQRWEQAHLVSALDVINEYQRSRRARVFSSLGDFGPSFRRSYKPLLAPGKRNAKDVPADTHGNAVRRQLGDVTDAEAMLPVLLICLLWPALAETSLLQTAVKRPVIPCVIHQTAKRHQLQENESLWAETWRAKNPQCKYKLWNDTEIAQLARTRSPDLMWPIWEGLTPVQRADVFRYLVLWDQGGYYADVDAACTLPIDQYKIPKEASMIVGYEMGHRLKEKRRAEIKFARMEQFQQWFLASAPGNPVLLRCMELIRQRYTWKIESTLELTGPGVFSDAVQEFLQQDDHRAVEEEVRIRRTPPKVHFLSYPSETLYGSGLWKMWLLAAGRAKVSAMVAREDPGEAPQNLVKHYFAGSWKTEKDFESRRASV